jgi:hypothetical protein
MTIPGNADPRAAEEGWLKAASLLPGAVLLFTLLALAAPAAGQDAESGPAKPAAGVSPVQAAPSSRKASKPAPAEATSAARSGSPSTAPGASGRRSGKGPRTLDEITIEGEIAVPQVLFITARERRHYRDFLHRNYLKDSRDLCREIPVPTRLASWLRP